MNVQKPYFSGNRFEKVLKFSKNHAQIETVYYTRNNQEKDKIMM